MPRAFSAAVIAADCGPTRARTKLAPLCQVVEAVARAEFVHQFSRAHDLIDIPAQPGTVGDRRAERDGRGDVQAVGRGHCLEGPERLWRGDQRAGTKRREPLRLRKRPADDDVRMRVDSGSAVSPQKSW